MKKILSLLMSTSVIVGVSSNAISCNIGKFSTRAHLESFDDFNWKTGQTSDGDGYNWYYDDFGNKITNDELPLESVQGEQGPVDKIFNYDKYSTSYKGANFIKKQATTGSPIIKSYRPNGNKWLDFGFESRSRKFNYINSLPDWNDGTDMDLDYNKASQKLKGRNYVAKKTVNTQQKQTFFNFFHDPSNSSSSIVGTKNTFGGNLTNLSYTHQMYTWPAITNKGWLTPSFADYTDYMHKNGVPVLGLWYMSGWEDLTRESLKSILTTDPNGVFTMVNILIQQCIDLNFDGWIINNEANGSQGDGYVIENSEINKIMEQFNERAKELEWSLGRKLSIIYYTNDSSLEYDPVTQKPNSRKTFEAAKSASAFQLDFVKSTPNLDRYIKEEHAGNNEKRKDLYTLLNESVTIPGLGAFDYKNLIFNKDKYNRYDLEKANNSFSIFGSGGANEYAKSFKNWANSENLINDQNEYKYLLMQQELSNLYSTYQMVGKNGYLENDQKGFTDMISQGQQDIDELYQYDPRIDFKKFNKSLSISPIDYLFKRSENNVYKYSVGVGSSFLEKTVVADTVIDNDYSSYSNKEPKEIENDPSMTTYFSTGSGIKFINRDSKGKALYDKITPWTNSRLGDVMPTYQWDFWSKEKVQDTIKIDTLDGEKNVSTITSKGQLAPYYDYYNPYMKGNSISVGMGYDFDNDGVVKPGIWYPNQDYYWNIMGTNLSKNNYNVSYFVKKSKSDTKSNDIINDKNTKITYTTSNENQGPKVIDDTKITEINDGWYKVTADLSKLSGINSGNRIAKLGLKINPANETKFLYSVGGFNISKNLDAEQSTNETTVKKIKNEYVVKRSSDNNNVNIRFNWDIDNKDSDYFNIFYSNDGINWYRLGQTTINKYYLRELNDNEDHFIYIGIQPVNKSGIPNKVFYSKIDTNYNY